VLLFEYGHLSRAAPEAIPISLRLRYQEAAQHPGHLVGPVARTQSDVQLAKLADRSYRGTFPINSGWLHIMLSCAYHNGEWTLSTDGQPVTYTWYDGPACATPAAITDDAIQPKWG
jgi:hypothetical protein